MGNELMIFYCTFLSIEEGTLKVHKNGPFPYKQHAEFVIEGLGEHPFKEPSAYGASQLKFIPERKNGLKIKKGCRSQQH